MLLLFSMATLFAQVESQLFQYEEIKEISLEGRGKVEIHQGSVNQLEVIGDLLQKSHGSVLALCITDPLQMKLTVKNLEKISLDGEVHVDINELKGKRLVTHSQGKSLLEGTLYFEQVITTIQGNAQATFQGKVHDQTICIKGKGVFAGESLETQKTTVTIQGAGVAQVWATDDLNSSVLGRGHIQYMGAPQKMHQYVEGMGRIFSYESF
ncbi:MAG: DUF2807 domain-containing protein [Chlamydiia bacterium]|nr:DUF2807 domain-containing protein [Chlamydiia bacterium]